MGNMSPPNEFQRLKNHKNDKESTSEKCIAKVKSFRNAKQAQQRRYLYKLNHS